MKLTGSLVLATGLILSAMQLSAAVLPADSAKAAKPDASKTKPQTGFTKSSMPFIEPDMVKINGGFFQMGSKDGDQDERPLHRVTLNSYKLGKYEVTVKEFAAFVNATGYKTDAEKKGDSFVYVGSKFERLTGVSWRDDEEGKKRNDSDFNKPVVHVSWNDATAYCQWLSVQSGKTYRLPTEAEWEYAAGSGMKHNKYSWGVSLPHLGDRVGNIADETQHPKYGSFLQRSIGFKDGYFYASPVGSFPPNELGLYDIAGNVWEWCSDWYDTNYYGAKGADNNPQGPTDGKLRIMRGGSWYFNLVNCRVPYRIGNVPDLRHGDIGFRIAQTL